MSNIAYFDTIKWSTMTPIPMFYTLVWSQVGSWL